MRPSKFAQTSPAYSRRQSQLIKRVIVAGCIGASVGSVGIATQSHAQGSYSQLLPPSRQELADEDPRTWTLKKFPSQPYMSEFYWREPSDTPVFFRESLLQVVARTYYLTRDNFDGTRSQAWAGGGWVAWRSGLIDNVLGMHAAYYTSQPIFAPADEGGTRLLTPNQNSLGMLGQIYGRIQIVDQEIRGGRQLVDTPLINPQDNRMVPNTFEGATLVTLPDKDRNYDYVFGYLWNIKQRDSNDFIPMSDAIVGGDTVNRGTPFGMIKIRPFAGFSTIFMDYYLSDFVNTGFSQAEYVFQLPKDVPQWSMGANIITQRSVGDELLTGTSFNTYQASAKVQMTYAGWTLFLAGSITGDESKIFSPFGTKPNYTDMQQISFDNAGEKAFGGSIAYDFGYAFKDFGLTGLSAGAWYTQGWGALDPVTNFAIPDRSELDLWIQYRPSEGPLKGLRVKTQYGNVWQDGNVRSTQPEFRFIVDYTVLFRPPIENLAKK
jgi:outer membrane OprD family porin